MVGWVLDMIVSTVVGNEKARHARVACWCHPDNVHANASSRVRINNTLSDSFKIKVGVHQGCVLSPLLFIIVMEALSCDFRTGCPFELLYADDLAIISDSMDNLLEKLRCWKSGLEAKGLYVNMAKTKLMISGINLGSLKDAGKHPCGVCRKGVS